MDCVGLSELLNKFPNLSGTWHVNNMDVNILWKIKLINTVKWNVKWINNN